SLDDAEVAAALVLDGCAEPLGEVGPEGDRLEGQRDLGEHPPLLAHAAGVHARGLAAHVARLEEERGQAALGEGTRARRADDAAAHDRDVDAARQHQAVLVVEAGEKVMRNPRAPWMVRLPEAIRKDGDRLRDAPRGVNSQTRPRRAPPT